MRIRNLALVIGVAVAMPCLAQNGGGAPPSGGAPGGGGPGGSGVKMVSMKMDQFFAEVNTSKSGKITKEEWYAAGLSDGAFRPFDSKNHGFLTLEELQANTYPADIDLNHDGVLRLAELKEFVAKSSSGGGAPAGGGAPGGSGGPPQQ
jgi:hypothetical protein